MKVLSVIRIISTSILLVFKIRCRTQIKIDILTPLTQYALKLSRQLHTRQLPLQCLTIILDFKYIRIIHQRWTGLPVPYNEKIYTVPGGHSSGTKFW